MTIPFPGFATAVWPRPADPAAVRRERETLAVEIAGLEGAAAHLARIAGTPAGDAARPVSDCHEGLPFCARWRLYNRQFWSNIFCY